MIKKFLLPFLIILILLGIFLIPHFIKVKIECRSQYGPCPNDLASEIGRYQSKSLPTTKSGISKLLKETSEVSDFSIQFKLPNVLDINILIKKPVAAIKDNNLGKFFLVDKDGKVLLQTDSTTLPTVIQDDSSVNLFTVQITAGIFEMYQIGTSEIKDNSLVVELPGPIEVIFPLQGDPEVLLGSLRLVYTKIQSPEFVGKFSQIDLRYKNPVLR